MVRWKSGRKVEAERYHLAALRMPVGQKAKAAARKIGYRSAIPAQRHSRR